MRHLIIGTAGHVDHGKTMLVKSLTGVDTDRLKEEKERGISIELGFAYLELPGGKLAGLVDVPGHERFIKNMLAGVGGIDLVLLIIAADEGIMPQTREHLDIIQLLQIQRGVVVITKVDLVDQEWLEMVREEINDFLKDTILDEAPVIETSAVNGRGIPELKQAIELVAEETAEKPAMGKVRMHIDRSFSVTGFGTVATGTLLSGMLSIGDPLEIMPQGILTKVRSLQSHGNKVETVRAGQRAAINISNVDLSQAPRGSVLCAPGSLRPAFRMDIRLLLLKTAPRSLKNRARVRIYLGTAEILGRIVLLDREELLPGDTTLAQMELEEKAAAAKGDRFVIRSYSPMQTIGGGTIIDPDPRKHKRNREDVISAITTREKGSPGELILQQLDNKPHVFMMADMEGLLGLSRDVLETSLDELLDAGDVKLFTGDQGSLILKKSIYDSWAEEITKLLKRYHSEYPLREGFPKEELRSRKFPFLNTKQFQALLTAMERDNIVKNWPSAVAAAHIETKSGSSLQRAVETYEKIFEEAGCQPPSWVEAARQSNLEEAKAQEILQYLLRRGALLKIGDDLYFHAGAIHRATQALRAYFAEHKEITIGEARDILGSSRKYVLPLMEYFDRERITRRVEDRRVAGRSLGI